MLYPKYQGGSFHVLAYWISRYSAAKKGVFSRETWNTKVHLVPNSLHSHSVWKSQKKSHSTLRAKRATFTFLVDKSSFKMPKMVNLASFWKTEAFGQTVLPDRSVLIGQKLVENAKIEKFKWDILDDFQTMWHSRKNSNLNFQLEDNFKSTPKIQFWLMEKYVPLFDTSFVLHWYLCPIMLHETFYSPWGHLHPERWWMLCFNDFQYLYYHAYMDLLFPFIIFKQASWT